VNALTRRLQFMLAVLLGLCACGQAVHADETGLPIALQRLSASRAEYESKMEEIRDDIVAEFDRLKTAELARKDDKANSSNLDDMRSAFAETGVLPSSSTFARLAGRTRSAREKLLTAYRANRKIAIKAGDKGRTIASELEAEIGHLETENDLVPWKTLPLDTLGEPVARKTPIALGVLPTGPYRLQMELTRTSPSGILRLESPLADEERIELSSAPVSTAEIMLMLTIREGMTAPDLGFTRPLEVRAAPKSETRTLSIWSKTGTFKVNRVRYKPVIIGDAIPKVAKASKPSRQRTSQTAMDLAPVGSVWRGNVNHSTRGAFNTRAEVTRSSNGLIAMKASWLNGHAVELLFTVKGTSLALKDVRNLGGPSSTRARLRGTGQVKGTRLTSSFFWIVSSGDLRNQQVSGSIALTREP